ncbi:MAG: hypothetical protein UD961_15860 [Bacteroidales bacterium]|nr:hypothetical protein [Bacteroidales bacterium]
MNTNITKTWIIEINEDEVFTRCTNETLYQAYGRVDENQKGDAMVIQDDDRGQFRIYFANAIANLHMMLARRMEEPEVNSGLTTRFTLHMHDNHDNNILPILINHCYQYVTRKVLEFWYQADFGSELEKLEINHCLHYRKHPVRRRIGPLF